MRERAGSGWRSAAVAAKSRIAASGESGIGTRAAKGLGCVRRTSNCVAADEEKGAQRKDKERDAVGQQFNKCGAVRSYRFGPFRHGGALRGEGRLGEANEYRGRGAVARRRAAKSRCYS